MKNTSECGTLRGGFISNVSIGKSSNKSLYENIWSFELTETVDGNFTPRSSSIEEAF